MARELTGAKVFAITASAFAVIIGVNVFMAVKAVGTFPGLEVENSYVASQTFDAERAAQERLGWTLGYRYEGGELILSFRDRAGQPVRARDISALIGRTTEAAEDKTPAFAYLNGDFRAPVDLGRGRWMVLLEARAEDGTRFHQRLDLYVKG
ncbi:MAG: FixH family protein [Paracoccaceae bacterium]|jgi:nitrogen fixation protein FixH